MGSGTVFQMTPSGTVTTLHAFAGGTDGASPYAAVILARDGNFYGTTSSGGPSNLGTVFQMIPSGTVTVLYAFVGSIDGAAPFSALVQGTDGNFYGTTSSGGTANGGTVFQMTPSGTVTVLHPFRGGTDGASPRASLIQGTDGNFYGTTSAGGTADNGTVFRMTPNGSVTVLSGSAFAGVEAGRNPEAALIQATDGNFYGTTYTGTAYLYGPVGYMPCEIHFMCGTVFQMTPSGAVTWLPFLGQGFADGTFGNHLTAALIQATDGQLYGTASAGGGDVTDGTIFRTTPDGHGGFVREVLHRFNGGADGAFPLAALIQATDGNFYGTTALGGTFNDGTVFQMTPSGAVAILHTFTGNDGACPLAALIQTPGGNFYGTTSSGGTSNAGTIFQMTPSGSVTVLHAFTGGTDGAVPRGPLIQGTDGNLYGTTSAGGASGTGVVFRLMLPPAATTLISPHGTIPTNLPSYAWQNVGTATAYYLRVNNSSGVPVIQAQYGAASCAATVCAVTPALPLPMDMYTWSVQTWNSVGYGPSSSCAHVYCGPVDEARRRFRWRWQSRHHGVSPVERRLVRLAVRHKLRDVHRLSVGRQHGHPRAWRLRRRRPGRHRCLSAGDGRLVRPALEYEVHHLGELPVGCQHRHSGAR